MLEGREMTYQISHLSNTFLIISLKQNVSNCQKLANLVSLIILSAHKCNTFVLYCQGFVNELVNESLNDSDARLLSVAFLVIRQVSLQGGHVFQPYATWFQVSVICVGNAPPFVALK